MALPYPSTSVESSDCDQDEVPLQPPPQQAVYYANNYNTLQPQQPAGRARSRSRGRENSAAPVINIFNEQANMNHATSRGRSPNRGQGQPNYYYAPSGSQWLQQPVAGMPPPPPPTSGTTVAPAPQVVHDRSRSRSYSPDYEEYRHERARRRWEEDYRRQQEERERHEQQAREQWELDQAKEKQKEKEDRQKAIQKYKMDQEKEKEEREEAVKQWKQEQKDKEDRERAIWEDYERKRIAKEEEEKRKKKEEDEKYKERMTRDLAKFGLSENQVDAIVEHDKDKGRHRRSIVGGELVRWKSEGKVRPTFIKVKKKDIETETLDFYDLDWEVSRDDKDYILILHELSEKETDILFEHTRRIRSRKVLTIEERKGRDNKPQYMMVRRPSKSRSKSRTRSESFAGILLKKD